MKDKREGGCLSGPCKMPRRCWQYTDCFLYGTKNEKIIDEDRKNYGILWTN